MKILATSSNTYYIRILDNVDEDLIRSFLECKKSYVAVMSPFIEIEGPDNECDEVVDFLYDNDIRFRIF